MVERVLENTGEMVRSQGVVYNVVAQSVLLYGSKRLFVTGDMI